MLVLLISIFPTHIFFVAQYKKLSLHKTHIIPTPTKHLVRLDNNNY